MHYPKVYILILNFNSWPDTLECLESVLKSRYQNYQVIIIDNCSSDNSLEYIKSWAKGELDIWVSAGNHLRHLSNPPVKKMIPYIYYSKKEAEDGGDLKSETEVQNLIGPQDSAGDAHFKARYPLIFIQTGCNSGYAGGNNAGIRYAMAKNDFEYIWILNNDTVIDSETLSNIVNSATDDKYDRPAGSYVYEYYEPEKLQIYGGLRVYKYFPLRPFFAKLNEDIDFIAGVSLFLSKRKITELGLIEEKYFSSINPNSVIFLFDKNNDTPAMKSISSFNFAKNGLRGKYL